MVPIQMNMVEYRDYFARAINQENNNIRL